MKEWRTRPLTSNGEKRGACHSIEDKAGNKVLGKRHRGKTNWRNAKESKEETKKGKNGDKKEISR